VRAAGPSSSWTTQVDHGDVIDVVQTVGTCVSHFAQELSCLCVAPRWLSTHRLSTSPGRERRLRRRDDEHRRTDAAHPRHRLLPATDDGPNKPFNKRVAKHGPVPVIFMLHGNHCPQSAQSHLGYDYFQQALAKMGFVAASVDSNELNCAGSGPGNIFDRADLLNASIGHFKT